MENVLNPVKGEQRNDTDKGQLEQLAATKENTLWKTLQSVKINVYLFQLGPIIFPFVWVEKQGDIA